MGSQYYPTHPILIMLMFIVKKLFKAGRKIIMKEIKKEIGRLDNELLLEGRRPEPVRRRQDSLADVIAPANNTEFYRLIIVVLIAVVIVKLF